MSEKRTDQNFENKALQLEQSEFLFKNIINKSQDLICIAGVDGYLKYTNPAWEKIIGYTQSELLARPFLDFIHPDDHKTNDKEVAKLIDGQITIDFENRYIHKNGSIRRISWRATPEAETQLIYCIGRDVTRQAQLTKELDEHRSDLEDIVKKRTAELQQEITERKRAEEILKDNQKFLDSIIEQSPYPTWISDTKGTMVRANPALKKALNLSDKQLIGKYNVFEDKQIEADILLILRDALEKGKTTDYELDWVGDQSGIDSMEKGNRVYCEGTMFSVYNQKGTITHAVITYKDVSDRKRTEEALVKSELLFSQMFEQSMTSTCIYNPEGTIIGANNEFCKMFGVDERTILNSGYNVFKDQNVIDAEILPLLKEIFENKKTNNWEIDFNIDKASESTQTSTSRVGKIFLEVFGYPVLNNKNIIEYVVLQHYDITDRKLAEKSIQKNQHVIVPFWL